MDYPKIDIMKKVRIDLYGGLGNQMFGGALGLALISQFPYLEVELSDRLIPLGSNPSRRLVINSLGLFNVERIQFKLSGHFVKKISMRNSFTRRLWWKLKRIEMRRTRISQEGIWGRATIKIKNPIFSDYFNNWFFIEIANKIIEIPSSPYLDYSNDILKRIQDFVALDDVITIHCRIGDFLNYPEVYAILKEEYFEKAIELIEKERGYKCKLVIFCESRSQMSEHYPHLAKRAAETIDTSYGISDVEVFASLCRSTNLIAANSTFSIWAAWFVQRRQARAIVPIADERTAIANGSIYLDWTMFDLSRCQFIKGDSIGKEAWLIERQKLFVRLDKMFH